jgi:diguanylate cyclase (GGDEF)-like protein
MRYKAQYTILLISIFIFIYQYSTTELSFPSDSVEAVAESIMLLTCIVVMFYIEQLKPYPKVYWLLFLGSSLYFIYSYVDLLEGFFMTSFLGGSNFDDVTKALGFTLLCIGIHRWITLHLDFTDEFRKNAETDHLTGLFNRRAFFSRVETEPNEKEGNIGAFLLMDIDHFKSINDTYGHSLGDTMLEGIGKLLKSKTRSVDTLSRWGGEEFLLYLNDVTEENALAIAESLRVRVELLSFQYKEESVRRTISIGIFNHKSNVKLDTAIDCADKALYQAKSKGRNCVVVYNKIDF